MSTINIGIQTGSQSYTIDVNQMRDRLEMMHKHLKHAIDDRGGDAPELAKRLNKIESQMARLDRLEGQNKNISAERAMKELDRGMDLLREGAQFLKRNDATDGAAFQKLEAWYDHLSGLYRHVDTEG